MRIAFYAPLKAPSAAIPSGDREMARQLIAVLERCGHQVEIASIFRSRDGGGDAVRQARLKTIGESLARRIVRRFQARRRRPEAWLTYHLYHKAPDWIGPLVSAALDIPYVVVEASFAPKQQGGPWTLGHRAVADALGRADAVISLNSHDEPCVLPLLRSPDRLHRLRPFTDVGRFADAAAQRDETRQILAGTFGLDLRHPLLLAVGMMRRGDKLASYRCLAEALATIAETPWQLLVVGDGEARCEVTAALDILGQARVRFAGEQSREAMPAIYAAADIVVWPACREAYGVSLLEAQAAGVPVVAGDAGGVSDIVRDGATGLLTPEGDAAAFAGAVLRLLEDSSLRAGMATAAMATARREHSLEAAGRVLQRALAAGRMGKAA